MINSSSIFNLNGFANSFNFISFCFGASSYLFSFFPNIIYSSLENNFIIFSGIFNIDSINF